jgi:hypothetical protein
VSAAVPRDHGRATLYEPLRRNIDEGICSGDLLEAGGAESLDGTGGGVPR